MEVAIRTRALEKSYGRTRALLSIDLEVEAGQICCLGGLEGAGKSTLLRILAGQLPPSSGEVAVLNLDPFQRRNGLHRSIGYLPPAPVYEEGMTPRAYLHFLGRVLGLGGRAFSSQLDSLFDLCGLSKAKERIGDLSLESRARLGIAQSLLGSPRVLLLDEPFRGLGGESRSFIMAILRAQGGEVTTLYSTPDLGDLEEEVNMLIYLENGRLLVAAPLHALQTRYGNPVVILDVGCPAAELGARLEREDWAQKVTVEGNLLRVSPSDLGKATARLPVLVGECHFPLRRLEVEELLLPVLLRRIREESLGRP